MSSEEIKQWYVYILRCSDDTLYTGYTNNLEHRLETHNQGKGAKYTRGRLPVIMEYSESFESKSEALCREAAIKKLSRIQKLNLFQ